MWGRYMWGTNVGRCVELNLACESARRMPIDRWAQAGENYWAGQETPWTQALTSCGTPRPCLVPRKICKIFQILRHIESLEVCMKY